MFHLSPLKSIRRIALVGLVIALSAPLVPTTASAAGDKELERVSGTVGYTLADNGAFNPVVGTLPLPDKAYAVTQANSAGILRMPDSSEIGLGQNTKVQLAAFNDIRNGPGNQITVMNGALKFDIRHPAGRKANYRFITPTSQIAVRGTIGLIAVATAANGASTTTIACVSGTFTATVGTTTVSLAAGQAVTVVGGSVTTSSLGSVVSSFQQAGITSPTGAGAGVGAGAAGGSTAGTTGVSSTVGSSTGATTGAIAGGGAAATVGAVAATTTKGGASATVGPLSVLVGGVPVSAQNQIFANTVPQSTSGTVSDPNFTGTINLSATNPGVIAVTPATISGSSGTFTATINGYGTGTLSATDGTNTVSSTFSVYGVLNLNGSSSGSPNLGFTNGTSSTAQSFTVQQSGPAQPGGITLSAACSNGAAVNLSATSASTGSSATTISVTPTAVPSGTPTHACTITVSGQAAQTGTVTVDISQTSITIQGKRQALPSTRKPF